MTNKIDMQALLQNMQALANQAGAKTAEPQKPFDSILFQIQESLKVVSQNQRKSDEVAEKFVKGDPDVSLVDVMVQSSKSKVLFHATTEIRDKLVSAYKEIWNMSA
ncbi:MAG: flagellar hook-basal body complex protein FliE [Gammaproteobacteria bacterium]